MQEFLVDGNTYSIDYEKMMHKAIKKVTDDIEKMKFNTSVATFMSMINEFYRLKRINKAEFKTFIQLLNPFAPHMTEELNQIMGFSKTLADTPWPTFDEEKLIDNEVEIPVQINGKLKGTVKVPMDSNEDVAKEAVHSDAIISALIENKNIIKEIYVKNKIYNIVIK